MSLAGLVDVVHGLEGGRHVRPPQKNIGLFPYQTRATRRRRSRKKAVEAGSGCLCTSCKTVYDNAALKCDPCDRAPRVTHLKKVASYQP